MALVKLHRYQSFINIFQLADRVLDKSVIINFIRHRYRLPIYMDFESWANMYYLNIRGTTYFRVV